jgi:hypothetical protein
MNRRNFVKFCSAFGVLSSAGFCLAAEAPQRALIAAAWRGPGASDINYAGVLAADWEGKTLEINYALALPTRPHGIVPDADGGLLVTGVRPGTWLLRCDAKGQVTQQLNLETEKASTRLNGHAIFSSRGEVIYATETDLKSGFGKIGVYHSKTLKKLDEWSTHAHEPHQLLLDAEDNIVVANGGILRTADDKKYNLHQMDSSLVRLDGKTGKLMRQWTLNDSRLSLRHLAWSHWSAGDKRFLGVAMQAEHDEASKRAAAPILAVLDGDELIVPSRSADGVGYAGDITAACNGGFALTNNKLGVAQLWHPATPDKLTPIVELQEAYALTGWEGPKPGGGVLVSTGLGLVRWHPAAKPAFLRWPKPMALDNHWVLLSEA